MDWCKVRYGPDVEGQEPALKTSCGIIQEIIGVDIPDSQADAQYFLKVKWYRPSLVQEDPNIRVGFDGSEPKQGKV
ncbi:hypothetical protein WJX77_007678 [Trebouxia sp. C0004]